MDDLRYPIGKADLETPMTPERRRQAIAEVEAAPAALRNAIRGLSATQLETPYRPGGWTVRQVVHHVPDSHLNSYIRFRWALTEDAPVIKAYHEDRWAELSDARTAPVETSIALLESLHHRWIKLLGSLTEDEWKRTFRHPELGPVSLEQNAALYAWHGRHHVAHIRGLRDRMRW